MDDLACDWSAFRSGVAQWFVAYTAVAREKAAVEDLRAAGFDAFAPMRLARERKRSRGAKRGPLVEVKRVLFPRYVFAGFSEGCSWDGLRAARGIEGVLSNDGRPLPVAGDVVFGLLRAVESGLYDDRPESSIMAGDMVRVSGGALAGASGCCKRIITGRRAEVVFLLFGGETLARVSLDQLVLVAPSVASGQPGVRVPNLCASPVQATERYDAIRHSPRRAACAENAAYV